MIWLIVLIVAAASFVFGVHVGVMVYIGRADRRAGHRPQLPAPETVTAVVTRPQRALPPGWGEAGR